MSFSSLGLNYQLLLQLNKQFYKSPYPIQLQAIPLVLLDKDIIAIAPTGSGKTVAYALPIIHKLIGKADAKNRHVKVLVLVPTRELAVQVEKVFKSFCSTLPEKIKTMAVFGGVSINPQMINMNGVQILVATPGRLLDLVESKAVYLSDVEHLVLDEADKMLNLGFADEMQKILQLLPQKRISALAMHSKKSQGSRTEALAQFKAGKIKVLVATDLMSRGIDIPFLPCVINYELPRSPKDYIHRIGRTGRAESAGMAISFVNAEEQHHFAVIQKKMKKSVEIQLPE